VEAIQVPQGRVMRAARPHSASPDELARHAAFIAGLEKPLWLEGGLTG